MVRNKDFQEKRKLALSSMKHACALEREERSLSGNDTKEKFLYSTVFAETLRQKGRQELSTVCSSHIKIYSWQYISPFF